MTVKEITAKGLTAKDAAGVVKVASAYKSEIFILSGNKKVNAKSLMGVIALGLRTPQKLSITADGIDEAEALKELASFMTR